MLSLLKIMPVPKRSAVQPYLSSLSCSDVHLCSLCKDDMAHRSSSFDLDNARTSGMQTTRTPQHPLCVEAFRVIPVNQVERFHGMMGAWFSWNARRLGSQISNIRLAATAFSSIDRKVHDWLSVDRCSFG